MSQLVDMDQNEMGWLAKHLGHDIHIHKEFYRMYESTLEMAVVGNLHIAIDEGPTNLKAKTFRIYPNKVLSDNCVDYIHLHKMQDSYTYRAVAVDYIKCKIVTHTEL